jgi:hypothetical protein
MSEQDQTKMAKAGKKNKYRFNNRGNRATRTSYKSKIAELEDDVFDVGAVSDPAKFSKSLKSIENYIQVNYKTCDDIVKGSNSLSARRSTTPSSPRKQNTRMPVEKLTRTSSRWQSLLGKRITKA